MSDTARPTRTFRAARVRYDPSRAERQSRVTRFAIETLGAAAAMPFLNADHPELGARPIDLASESADACTRVEAAITAARSA